MPDTFEQASEILTHIIEGYVIRESSEPFPVSRSALLSEMIRREQACALSKERKRKLELNNARMSATPSLPAGEAKANNDESEVSKEPETTSNEKDDIQKSPEIVHLASDATVQLQVPFIHDKY